MTGERRHVEGRSQDGVSIPRCVTECRHLCVNRPPKLGEVAKARSEDPLEHLVWLCRLLKPPVETLRDLSGELSLDDVDRVDLGFAFFGAELELPFVLDRALVII